MRLGIDDPDTEWPAGMAYAMSKFGMSSGIAAWPSTSHHLTIRLNPIAACSW